MLQTKDKAIEIERNFQRVSDRVADAGFSTRMGCRAGVSVRVK